MHVGIFRRQEKRKKKSLKRQTKKIKDKEIKKTGSFWFYIMLCFLESNLF